MIKKALLLIAAAVVISPPASAAPAGNGVVPKLSWLDSYSANGRCYIDSTFDHGIGNVLVDTPIGKQTVRQVAAKIGSGPGRAGNPVYNDVQCGNGPANSAGDEDYDQCPGRVDQGAAGCAIIGPTWRLDLVYASSGSTNSSSSGSSNVSNNQTCEVISSTLAAAKSEFASACKGFVRKDCDPGTVDGKSVWMCASYNIANPSVIAAVAAQSGQSSGQPSGQSSGQSTDQSANQSSSQTSDQSSNQSSSSGLVSGRCDALGDTLSLAKSAYTARCEARRVDCDPTGNKSQYLCASYNIVGKPVPSQGAIEAATASSSSGSSSNSSSSTSSGTSSGTSSSSSNTSSAASSSNDGQCDVTAATLSQAIAAYAAQCSLPRKDCDPVPGGYKCASYFMGANTPASSSGSSTSSASSGSSSSSSGSTSGSTSSSGSSGSSNSGQCDVTAPTLSQAMAAYTAQCSLPRKDCDPVSGGYKCASYVMGANGAPASGGNSGSSSQTTTTAPTAGTIRIQAESQVGSGWVNRGSYIEFTGANNYASPTYGSLVYNVTIPAAGDWELRWRAKAAKQTPGRTDLHNDAWAKMNGQPLTGFHDVRSFKKVFSPGNGAWHIAGTAEHGTHNFSKFRQRFSAGTYQFYLSGRSNGYAIDYIEFVQINGVQSSASQNNVPSLDPLGGISHYLNTFNQPYVKGDLLSLHWDSAPDPDDMQAMILSREILDSHSPKVDYIAVNGAKRVQASSLVNGSSAHMKSLFPGSYEAFRNGLSNSANQTLYNNTVNTVATAWALTLAAGNRVHVAEGGPSDFTASVINELLRRNVSVSSLKNIRVVQHSWGWNENNTSSAALLTVRRYTEYIRIADGNHAGGHSATPDYNWPNDANCAAFRARAAKTPYASQWNTANARLPSRCDGSDAVEVLWILGVPTSSVPNLAKFADRYF